MTSPTFLHGSQRTAIAPVGRGKLLGSVLGLLPFLLLTAVFVFAGLTGHDPWKADEPYIFGIIHSIVEDNSWLVPKVAGEPFMEKPPLYAWCAALMAKALAGVLSEPDAARLVSGGFMLATCAALAMAARNWWGAGMGRFAPVVLIACLGVTVQSHMMMPDVPLLTGFALAAWAFSVIRQQPTLGGWLLGLGVGIGFLSKGLFGPGVLGLTALVLPACFRQWRERRYFTGLVTAFCVALPMLTVWPALLYERSPELFRSWFWENNFGRFLGWGNTNAGTEHAPDFWLQTLPWFTFPALPLALLVAWQRRRDLLRHPGTQCALAMICITSLVLAASASARAVYAMPLLVPLAILATPSVHSLRVVAGKTWIAASVLLFGALAAVIWCGWFIMMQTGRPPQWAWLIRLLPADFVPDFQPAHVLLSIAMSVGAALIVCRPRLFPTTGRPLLVWTAGVTLVWVLLSNLWMPWLDYGKSYRAVFDDIPWPMAHRCIASINLGESERAMLDYYSDRVTERREVDPKRDCDLLLLQGYASTGTEGVDLDRWEPIWTGARPGDDWQQFWLFREKQHLQ